MGWFTATLLAVGCYGVLQAIQRITASRGVPARHLLLASATTVALLAAGGWAVAGGRGALSPRLLLLAALNAILFTAGTLALLSAHRVASAAVTLPVAKLDGVLVVLVGAVAFAERPAPLQVLGVLMAFGVVGVLTLPGRGGSGAGSRRGVLLAGAAACCYAASMTVGKLAALSVPKLPYVAVSYALVAVSTFALLLRARGVEAELVRMARRTGIAVGVLNFAGYVLLLHAFEHGPMVLVQPLFATSMLVAVAGAALVLRERLTGRHAAALALSLGAAVLIRFG